MASYLICPDSASIAVDSSARPTCKDGSGNSAWIIKADTDTGFLPPLTLAEGAEISTAILLLMAFAFNWKNVRNAG